MYILNYIPMILFTDNIRIPSKSEKSVCKTTVKPERFGEVLRGKSPDEIVDDGHIPGDKWGAAGLDSSFFG